MFPSSLANLIDYSRRPGRATSRRAVLEDPAVLIRHARPADEPAIARLAALDEHDLPAGERLIAELDGRAVAAIDVASGAAVADPFVRTSAIVELLGLRAEQVRS